MGGSGDRPRVKSRVGVAHDEQSDLNPAYGSQAIDWQALPFRSDPVA